MKNKLFDDSRQRLEVLDEKIRKAAVKYAEEFYRNGKCSKQEALERGIIKAELEKRNL
ncbi:MAG: hypothetical protein RIG62_05315 [Cyclobacteriaceae bacterium]